VTAGNRAPVSTPTLTVMTFVASGGSSGQYTWTLDGTVQSATAAEFTTSFSTAGPHTVSVMASADGFYAASLPAAFDVSVTAGNIWTVATGQGQVIALRSDGTVWAWGENGSGQLGDGTTTDRNAPVAVTGLTGVVAIAAGGAHSAAVKSDGTVWTWGENGSGQLGDGTVTTRLTPVQVTGVTGVVALAAGTNHMLALKSDGTVWTWGGNASGQLGDGTTGSRPVAAAVSGLTNVKALAAGPDHSLAVKTDGTVWAWGKNEAGQTGDGTTANRVTPSQVPGFTGVIEVAAGASHSVALKSDGTVWAWGGNASGQLGDGTVTTRPSPVQVGGLSGMLAIGAGSNHSIAVKTDGSVVAWGKNAAGQLGDGTTTNRPSPGVVGGLASIVALAGHGAHTFAVATDGTVYSWGGDGFGSATIANLRLNQAAIRLTAAAGDADQDGMLDALENQYFGTTSRAGGADQDGDGLSDVQELYLGGDPTKADTDGDAVGDLDDPYPADYYDNAVPSIVVLSGNHQTGHAGQFNSQPFDLAIATNPGDELLVNAPVSLAVTGGGGSLATSNLATAALAPNLSLRTDAAGTVKVYYKQPVTDGISSQIDVTAGGAQLFLTTLSSTAADADGDGLLDAWELQHFGNTSPTGAEDADGDGLTNLVEMALGTDPTNPDSDNDGMNDGAEYTSGRNPLDRIDSVPLPAAYRLILRLPPSAYLGVKPDWTLDSVDAP
jgi:alpha-tubulin suppressor-like RCC1 family protein